VALGFDLAGNGGAVLDNLRARAREEPCQLLGFRRDRDAAQATVRQVDGQFLGVTTIGFDSIVGSHGDGCWIDDEVRDPRGREGAVQHEAGKPGLRGRRQRGARKPPQQTLGKPHRLRRNGRGFHNLSLAHAGHRLGGLMHIDTHIDPFADIREAWRCHGAFLSR